MLFVLLQYALFASVFTLAKTALDYTEPFFLIGARMTLAGVLMLGFLALFQRHKLKFSRSDLFSFMLLGVMNIYLTNALEFWGLKYLTSFKTCFIYSLSPFASALLSWFIFKERMTPKKWLGLTFGFAGFLPLFLAQSDEELLSGTFLSFSWAELSVAGAALCSVWGWIILKGLVFNKGYSPLLANGLAMLTGGVMALVHSALVENWDPVPVSSLSEFMMLAAALLVVSNLLGYNLYGWLLKRFSPTFMSLAGSTTPLFCALFGWYFLDESITAAFWLSTAIVIAGLALFYQEELVLKSEPSVN